MDTTAQETTRHGRDEKPEKGHPKASSDAASKSANQATNWNRFVFDPAESIPPEQPIYEGLLAKGDLAVWLGREKHRKSSVLLQFAICAAVGRPFLHFPLRPSGLYQL